MDEKALYAQILGVTQPWQVERVDLRLDQGEVHIWVALPLKTLWVCPECEERAPIYDHQERQWRHLDTCQYKTLIHARVPRLHCPRHGIKQLAVPWAETRSRFTALFEALVIDWLRQATIRGVAARMRLTWDETAGIMDRAVLRGLARRRWEPVSHLGIDEKSFRRGHRYVTVISDLGRGCVLDVRDDRRQESLDAFWRSWPKKQRAAVDAVTMDMWEPYIQSTLKHLPEAASKIVFDKFHIAKHLGDAVDRVRRLEHRELQAQGKDWLTGTKYDWLRHPSRFTEEAWQTFTALLHHHHLRTGRAWTLKEAFMGLYEYADPETADRHFQDWYRWARRSHLEPMKKVALTLKRYWTNIQTYFVHRLTNAGAETINSIIQRVKVSARGFRNRHRFRMAILFHCGKLDLYPSHPQFSS